MSAVIQHKVNLPTGPHPHAVIEILEDGLSATGSITSINKVFRIISGSEAFRTYNWLKNVPATNVAGDFRGMVVNARWRGAYQISNKLADNLEAAGNYIILASLALNLYKNKEAIARILSTKDPSATKAAKLSALTSSMILATIAGVVPAGAHLLALSLEGYLRLASLASGQKFNSSDAIKKLAKVDASVRHAYKVVSDGDELYYFLTTHFVYDSPKFLKFP